MFEPGSVWNDSDGQPVQAHGGGVLYDGGTYYWFGEHKGAPNVTPSRVDVIGVACYTSTDLIHWHNAGLALPAVPDDPAHDLHPSKVIERPKVVRNDRTGQYVMWLHADSADYMAARAGVAVSDTPAGPYHYLGSVRPCDRDSRDMTLFKDDDGTAYLIFSSEINQTMTIARLSDDYLQPTGEFWTAFPGAYREAPALFKHAGRYFLITSGCTGWSPNAAEYAVADAVSGPWHVRGNPCVGAHAERTFDAQSTFVLPVAGRSDAFIFMADRWNATNLQDSRYVWLPIRTDGDALRIEWRDQWDLSIFD